MPRDTVSSEGPAIPALLASELRRLRKSAGLSQPQLALLAGYSKQYISRAESPHRGLPSPELVQAVDRALNANGLLVALREQAKAEQRGLRTAAQLEAHPGRGGLAKVTSTGESRLGDYVGGEEDDVKRRTLLGLGSVAMTSPLVDKLEEVRRGLDDMLPAEPTGRDADDWEQAVANYAHEVGTMPAVQLLSDLVADFAEIKVRITEATGLVRTSLIHSGTQLAALTAISLLNLREPRSAERWWRTASRAAEGSADPELAALVSGRQAVFSLHVSPPPRVLALAEAAVARGGHTPCVGAISGLAARAQTLSELGRHSEANVTLRHVTAMFEHLPATAQTDQHSQWNWAEQRLRHVESHVHAHAGRVDQARAAQEAASACYPASNFQGRTQVAMYQAVALIRSGDVRTGSDHLTAIFDDLRPWQRGDGLVLRSAEAVLRTIPLSQRQHPSAVAAADKVGALAGAR